MLLSAPSTFAVRPLGAVGIGSESHAAIERVKPSATATRRYECAQNGRRGVRSIRVASVKKLTLLPRSTGAMGPQVGGSLRGVVVSDATWQTISFDRLHTHRSRHGAGADAMSSSASLPRTSWGDRRYPKVVRSSSIHDSDGRVHGNRAGNSPRHRSSGFPSSEASTAAPQCEMAPVIPLRGPSH